MSKQLKLDLEAVLVKHHDAPLELQISMHSLIARCAEFVKWAECQHPKTKTEMGSCFYGEYETTICKTCGKVLETTNYW
jgi:hypothetical protein